MERKTYLGSKRHQIMVIVEKKGTVGGRVGKLLPYPRTHDKDLNWRIAGRAEKRHI